ncbi:MAG: hypothetical protein MR991_03675 [Clostridiales bacterium]|nr:hypothetical protein [Clostridiales bacterium]MDD7034712.1 hypothetical protein [Bacillota bacterium]MDY2919660.1 hypothetical protein [Lentihominibacter sp.]
MNISMVWPIALAVFADIFYQISTKSTPANINPFASLTITYLVGAAVAAVIFFITSDGQSLLTEWKSVNWTAFILGLAIVGLEAGSIYMYKAGWNINTGYIVKSIILAIALIGVGYVLYKEPFSLTKAAGIAVCLVGLFIINY